MSTHYQGEDLVEIAMGMELCGIAFYTALIEKSTRSEAKSVCSALATAEKKHLDRFESMLKALGSYQPDEAYAGEYHAYLKALAEDIVFSTADTAVERARSAASDGEAIDIGIRAEKDSILFYDALRGFVQPSDRGTVEAIIEEERSHLRQLIGLKAALSKK